MTLAYVDIIDWLAIVCERPAEDIKTWLWVALVAGLVVSTMQFAVMMVTRWGNKEVTWKALMCSVLIHLSITTGAVVVSPPPQIIMAVTQQKKEPTQQIREVVVEGHENAPASTGGNTPVWEKLPDSPQRQLARLEKAPLDFRPLEGPERRKEESQRPDIEIPSIPQLPEMPVARPEIQNTAEVGEKLESAAPLKIDDQTAEARPEVNVPTVTSMRRPTERPGVANASVERQSASGSVQQIGEIGSSDVPLPSASVPLPSVQASAPQAMIERDVPSEKIQRRRGPTPVESSAETVGSGTVADTNDGAVGAVGKPKFDRLRTRTPKMEESGGVQRFQPEKTPLSPNPVPGPVVGVREGVASVAPVDGIKPNAVRPNFDPINRAATSSLPPTYRLRNLAKRAETARKYGGTDASERAVEGSLKWLALHQSPEGFWDADGYLSQCPEGDQCRGRGAGRTVDDRGNERVDGFSQADAGVTGLVILAFLGAGYTHEEGPYADQVDRALSWLIRNQRSDGYLGAGAARFEQMYCHAIATYAMAEALGMQTDRTSDRRLRVPLQRAVGYIVSQQSQIDGGWRYEKGQRSDMSMFGWQLMALKSAEIAGIPTPEASRKLMIQFLKERSLGPRKGLAAYRVVEKEFTQLPPTHSMTAEALFCKQMLGMKRENEASLEAVEFVMAKRPSRETEDIYYWYYATLALYQFGGNEWRLWNADLREYLIRDQRTTGHAAGSWDPKGPWGVYGGRVFQTALSTLSLEVYYRFLPLYQIQKSGDVLE